jgi:hypothetical protein
MKIPRWKTNPSKQYDMRQLGELKRWFREMEGYLKCGRDCKPPCDFINQGTDKEGRAYALDGFYQLKKELCFEDKEASNHD